MEDDALIRLVKLECAGVQERLIVPGCSDVSDFGFAQVSADPIIVAFIFSQALVGNGGGAVISWHELSFNEC